MSARGVSYPVLMRDAVPRRIEGRMVLSRFAALQPRRIKVLIEVVGMSLPVVTGGSIEGGT
jgi:hypothetical protein